MKITRSYIESASRANNNEVVGSSARSGGGISRSVVLRKNLTKSKSRNLKDGQLGNSNVIEKFKFLISKIRKAFNHLKQVFIKVLILQYFDPKYHIRIETNISDYTIEEVLN